MDLDQEREPEKYRLPKKPIRWKNYTSRNKNVAIGIRSHERQCLMIHFHIKRRRVPGLAFVQTIFEISILKVVKLI